MAWTAEKIPNQNGRIALITGANSGLGLETCFALLNKGATVIMGCRSLIKAQKARDSLLSRVDSGSADILIFDLADFSSVLKAAEKVINDYGRLDLLINNAGIMAPPYTLSKQGFELQFAVNHLGHFALTKKLLPIIRTQKDGRVVTVTSGSQYMGKIKWDDLQSKKTYNRWEAYSQSKVANTMFAVELESRESENKSHVTSLSAHPGIARTNLQEKSIRSSGSWQEAFTYRLLDPFFQSASMGSLPQLYAATSSEAKSGEQYGPKFNFRGYPKSCTLPSLSLDKTARKQLWEISEKLISHYF